MVVDSDSDEIGVAGSKSVLYQDLVAILTEALQEQSLELVEVNEKLDELERAILEKDEAIENLEERIRRLEDLFNTLQSDKKLVTINT